MDFQFPERTRAQESRAAIERLYIIMRHLFNRGSYKPLGVSGQSIINAMLTLRPEIYGSIADPERVELDGLLYVIERLPKGIEECRFLRLISKEGYDDTHFKPIIPPKRIRNCYRIDDKQMYIEMTRGRSDIYDILTHLTFMYIESEKICNNALDPKGEKKWDWMKLEEVVNDIKEGQEINYEVALSYLSTLLGRTYEETEIACQKFEKNRYTNNLFQVAYWLGNIAIEERKGRLDREITFSSTLRERIGHHIYGELWAVNIKEYLRENGLLERPIHIISSNLHSVMNSFFGVAALKKKKDGLEKVVRELSIKKNKALREQVRKFALANGMVEMNDTMGTNILVQIFDLEKMNMNLLPEEIKVNADHIAKNKPVLIIMDYAFGEQAFETMDELLKPYEVDDKEVSLNVESISVMGKAGILNGDKGDIMIPTSHIFEGTADNYPFDNKLRSKDFEGKKVKVFEGSMVTVLGTSLQNKDILRYFLESSWKSVGLEMEGAHYQKAIQAASKIRKTIREDVDLRYAYYASDNPLVTGSTLASGSLGLEGVKPTYMITVKILNQILDP